MLRNKTILITGGTGSFGQKFTEVCIRKHKPKKRKTWTCASPGQAQ